ncbi:Uncharacterized protein dnl_30490 [Desulfonema limicola]|uniref:Uncharacterized protein n=1 Tax=Desulfonema limicola TaxID=45656 RepID=A0A975B8R3_9BACT|nr:Uncharacterized protein dnl_30490 [Desulfonema limicola]
MSPAYRTPAVIGFNPCFHGSTTVSGMTSGSGMAFMLGFNPCFHGSTTVSTILIAIDIY